MSTVYRNNIPGSNRPWSFQCSKLCSEQIYIDTQSTIHSHNTEYSGTADLPSEICSLHWLQVTEQIKHKITVLTHSLTWVCTTIHKYCSLGLWICPVNKHCVLPASVTCWYQPSGVNIKLQHGFHSWWSLCQCTDVYSGTGTTEKCIQAVKLTRELSLVNRLPYFDSIYICQCISR